MAGEAAVLGEAEGGEEVGFPEDFVLGGGELWGEVRLLGLDCNPNSVSYD